MESDDKKERSYQARSYLFPGGLDQGALAHSFMTVNEPNNSENKGNDPKIKSLRNPSEILTRLELPENLFGSFLRLLQSRGFGQASLRTDVSVYGERSYTYLPAKDGREPRIFIYIPEWILSNPANRDSIIALGAVFREGSFLLIFSESPLSGAIKQIIKYGWTRRYRGCELISLGDIEDLKKENPQMQNIWIMNWLGFQAI